jgi:hypothetical protein
LVRESLRSLIGWVVEQMEDAMQSDVSRTLRLGRLFRRLGCQKVFGEFSMSK